MNKFTYKEAPLPANEFPLNPLCSLELVLKQIILIGEIWIWVDITCIPPKYKHGSTMYLTRKNK